LDSEYEARVVDEADEEGERYATLEYVPDRFNAEIFGSPYRIRCGSVESLSCCSVQSSIRGEELRSRPKSGRPKIMSLDEVPDAGPNCMMSMRKPQQAEYESAGVGPIQEAFKQAARQLQSWTEEVSYWATR
jgi:hypothetical protein